MPSIFGRAIVNTKTNKSGGALAKGDVVVLDSANDNAVTTTTTGATTVTVGIVVEENGIANNASGRVQFGGHVALVNVNASVTRGHYGATHTVAKQATDAGASRVVGAFCYFTTGGTTPEADLFIQPDASSATGNVATDAIWDAAGDLAVGSGANTAAKLVKGAAGGALSIINAAVAWNSGTSFPGSVTTGDRYWRTDHGREYYYDGTRWVSVEIFGATTPNATITATFSGGPRISGAVTNTGLDLWLVAADLFVAVFGTNDGSNFWTYTIDKRAANDTGTTLLTANTSAVSASTWVRVTTAIGASCAISGAYNFVIQASVKTGAPANLQIGGGFTYRLIAT